MLDALREADPLGRRQRSLARQAERAQAELANRTGQRPSAGAVAEQLGLRLEQYFRVQQSLAAVRKMSLEDRDLADGTAEGVGGSAPRHHTSGLEVMAGLAREDTSELIARALTNLPDRQRTIVELVYLKGMQGKDIATLMNLSKARVSQLLTKARHQLRRAIERESKEQGLSWRETVGTPTR